MLRSSLLRSALRRCASTAAARAVPEHYEAAIRELEGALPPETLSRAPAVLAAHGKDEAYFTPTPPDCVLFARSTDDVALAVRIAAQHRMPVVPFGVGTSLEGHIAAVEGGLSIDMGAMNAVLEVNQEDMDCRVQAGVTREALNDMEDGKYRTMHARKCGWTEHVCLMSFRGNRGDQDCTGDFCGDRSFAGSHQSPSGRCRTFGQNVFRLP